MVNSNLTYPAHIVDMHTHMFNAKYLPLKSIFRSWRVPKMFAGWGARLSYKLTHISSFPSVRRVDVFGTSTGMDDKKYLDHNDDEVIEKYIDALAHDSVLLFRKTMSYVDTDVSLIEKEETPWEVLLYKDLYELFVEIDEEFGDPDSRHMLELCSPQQVHLQRDALATLGWGWLWGMLKKFLRKLISFIESAGDVIDFIYNLTKNERDIYKRLNKYYSDRNVKSVLIHHMMDMKWAYKKGRVVLEHYKTKKGRPSQLSQMRGLQLSTNNCLFGFAGFDPHRFVKNKASEAKIISHMQEALGYGMIGFKFYPPLDYRPAENEKLGYDRVVDIFLDYCTEHEIPVFTHCTPVGFERKKGTGINADPKYWRTALEKKDRPRGIDRSKLRLCFGHAGGGVFDLKKDGIFIGTSYGWLSEKSTQWDDDINFARHVAEMCREFPNVYCEFAHIIEILKNDVLRDQFQNRLRQELEAPLRSGERYVFGDKIMFGTDWHMKEMVNDVDEYFDYIVGMFNTTSLNTYADRFFAKNAIQFLGRDVFA